MDQGLYQNIMEYLRFNSRRYTRKDVLEIIHNLQNGGLFDGSHVEEFKGTDGIVAFYMNNEDRILEYLAEIEVTFTGVLDAVGVVFSTVLDQEQEKYEAMPEEAEEEDI